MKKKKNEKLVPELSPEEFKKSVEEVIGNELVERVENGYIYFKPFLEVMDDKTGREIKIPLTQQFIDAFFNSLLEKGGEGNLKKPENRFRPLLPKQ